MGSRRMSEVWTPSHSADALPSRLRAAPAKKDTLSIEPGTSNSVVSRMGLPHCRVSTRAYSSARPSSRAASRVSAADRSAGVAPAHSGKAALAAATATSTSRGGRVGRGCRGRCRRRGSPRPRSLWRTRDGLVRPRRPRPSLHLHDPVGHRARGACAYNHGNLRRTRASQQEGGPKRNRNDGNRCEIVTSRRIVTPHAAWDRPWPPRRAPRSRAGAARCRARRGRPS